MKKIAIIGATGLVGNAMLQVISQLLPDTRLQLYASQSSKGRTVTHCGQAYTINAVDDILADDIDIALMAADCQVSEMYSPLLANRGTTVIDSSSFFRMKEAIPLVVPEVNSHTIGSSTIIASPNCSTIQAVVALAPLHREYKISRIVYSTYQSVSGAGYSALQALKDNTQYSGEVIPYIDTLQQDGYTKEEHKMIQETQKILESNIDITATCVRVPVHYGHSISINVELSTDISLSQVKQLLRDSKGVSLQDMLPTQVAGKDEVYVSRIRTDYSRPNTLNLWVVADNIRKGAATNAVQIAQLLI